MGAPKGIIKNKEFIGKNLGSLFVVDLVREDGKTLALCTCVCGNTRRCEIKYLKEHPPVKCTCKRAIVARLGGLASKKHGDGNTRLYQIWENIRQRCHNPNYKAYKDYGGRGISRCEEWKDFLVFKKWALENGYADNLTIDRVDNGGNYTPENCRWITLFEQAGNTRKNRRVKYNGEFIHVSEFARRLNIRRGHVLYLLNTGRSVDEIVKWVSIPKAGRKSNKDRRFTDEQVLEMRKLSKVKTIRELSLIFGGTEQNIGRIVRGERYKHIIIDPKLDEILI